MLVRLLLFSVIAAVCANAQTTVAGQGSTPAAIARQAGTDADSGIHYVLLSASGKRVAPAAANGEAASAPQLVAQCSVARGGKYRFELLTDFGTATSPLVFAAPWHAKPDELYPPALTHVPLTMQFIGYTKYKPVRRQWETLLEPSGWLRYATPGMSSGNMEQIMFYLQVLRALPTLRLVSKSGAAVEFETSALQQAIHAEPLCHASGL